MAYGKNTHNSKDSKSKKTTKDNEREEELLEKIKKNFQASEKFFSDDYDRNRKDAIFTMGDQWPEKIRRERTNDRRPILTENRLLPFVMKTVNEIRKSRPSILVKPVADGSDEEVADILGGIIRNIQNQSDAETCYDTAAQNAIMSGFGWIRIGTRYAEHDSFEQEIFIDRILNPFSVYMDPMSTRMDGSDAEFIMTFEEIDKDVFEEDYEHISPDSIGSDARDSWFRDNTVRVVEYYYKDYESKTLYEFLKADGEEGTGYELPEGADELRSRSVDICTIKYCKATYDTILEESEFVGKYIPIVPVFGLEVSNDDKREIYSLVHQAIDPQRMFNYWNTASTEVAAMQPKTPWVGATGQFANNPKAWAESNIKNIAFLEYKPISINGVLAPPPARQPVPTASATMMQSAMMAADGIKASLGMYDPAMGQRSSETSGKAILQREMQGENSTYHFVDNLVTSMKQVGRILVDIIPKVYSGKRVIRIVGEDGTSKQVAVNQPAMKQGKDLLPMEQGATEEAFHRLGVGKYDVVVEVGSSWATKRQEAASQIMELGRILPNLAEVAPDLLVKSIDMPYANDIAERLRANMDPALLGEDVEAKRLQSMAKEIEGLAQKLEQTELALQVKDDNQKFQNTLEEGKLRNETEEVRIKAQKVKAEIEKLNAEARIEIPAEAAKDMAEVKGQLSDLTEVIELIVSNGENQASEVEVTVVPETTEQ